MTVDDQEAVREEVIESMERSAEVYGLSRSAGRVYGTLYFAAGPLSIPELVERTGYAKSTISTVTRQLTRIGLVRRRSSEGGGRRVTFEPERDIWFVVRDVFRQYVRREMEVSQRALSDAAERLSEGETATAERDRERVEELQETYEGLQRLLELTTEREPAELVETIEEYDAD